MEDTYYRFSQLFNNKILNTTSLFAYDYINDLIEYRLDKYIYIYL